MYCEASLSGARPASDGVPDYLRTKQRRIPWNAIFLALMLGAGAFYYFRYWEGPTIHQSTFPSSPHAVSFALSKDRAVEIQVDWPSGRGEIVLRSGINVIASERGSSPLVLSRPLGPGEYQVEIQVDEAPGRVTITRE